MKNIAYLRKRASARKTLGKRNMDMGKVSGDEVIVETHIAGICLVGGVTRRLFGIAKGPFPLAVGVPVRNRRGLRGRDEDRG